MLSREHILEDDRPETTEAAHAVCVVVLGRDEPKRAQDRLEEIKGARIAAHDECSASVCLVAVVMLHLCLLLVSLLAADFELQLPACVHFRDGRHTARRVHNCRNWHRSFPCLFACTLVTVPWHHVVTVPALRG